MANSLEAVTPFLPSTVNKQLYDHGQTYLI